MIKLLRRACSGDPVPFLIVLAFAMFIVTLVAGLSE